MKQQDHPIRETGSMPILEWFLNLFKRKKKDGLTRKQRMKEYYEDQKSLYTD